MLKLVSCYNKSLGSLLPLFFGKQLLCFLLDCLSHEWWLKEVGLNVRGAIGGRGWWSRYLRSHWKPFLERCFILRGMFQVNLGSYWLGLSSCLDNLSWCGRWHLRLRLALLSILLRCLPWCKLLHLTWCILSL